MEEHASLLGCGTAISFPSSQAGAHIQVRSNIIPSLELRSVHRRAIAKAEMGRWCTGSFTSLKPELAFLTHESCLQQLVWGLTSHWKRLNKRFLIPRLHVPFPDWVLKSPPLHCCFLSPERDPPWEPGSLSGGTPWQEQHWGAWDQSRGTALSDLARAAS